MNAKIAILHVIDLFNIYIKISSRNVKLYIISGNLSKICKNCCRTACSGSTGISKLFNTALKCTFTHLIITNDFNKIYIRPFWKCAVPS